MSDYTNKPSNFGSVDFWQRCRDDSCGENSLFNTWCRIYAHRHISRMIYISSQTYNSTSIFMAIHFTSHKIKSSLFHPPTLAHHGPIYTALYIQHSLIWNPLPCPSVLIYSDLFPTIWHAKSSARLSHSFPFPHTVRAMIMFIIISYHDILYVLTCFWMFTFHLRCHSAFP